MNIVLAGFRNLWTALTQIWRLKQSLFYLIGMKGGLGSSPKTPPACCGGRLLTSAQATSSSATR